MSTNLSQNSKSSGLICAKMESTVFAIYPITPVPKNYVIMFTMALSKLLNAKLTI